MKKKKILFYSLDGYSTFFTSTNYIFGGIETDTAYYAKSLAEYPDMEISVITKNHKKRNNSVDNVHIIQHPNIKGEGYWEWRKSLKGKISFRILGDKKINTGDFYNRINPDVVFCMGLQTGAEELLEYCKCFNKKFIFKVAHDRDIKSNDDDSWGGISQKQFSEIANYASCVLVQTPFQYQLLKEKYNIDGIIHYNPIELNKNVYAGIEKKYDLFWAGRSTAFKRPELFIELCKRLPELKACMVMNISDIEYWKKLAANIPSNIELIKSIPFDKIDLYFAQSRLFISTSGSEGFANTYLLAAKQSIPVLSMCCDPNSMLTKYEAGVVVGDNLDNLAYWMKKLLSDKNLYSGYSIMARKYVETFHDRVEIARQLHTLILGV